MKLEKSFKKKHQSLPLMCIIRSQIDYILKAM